MNKFWYRFVNTYTAVGFSIYPFCWRLKAFKGGGWYNLAIGPLRFGFRPD